MAELKAISVSARASHDEELYYVHTFKCSVQSNGMFYALLSVEEYEEIEAVAEELTKRTTAKLSRSRGLYWLVSPLRADLERVLQAYAEWKVAFTEERELVIIYRMDVTVHYVKHLETGEIFESGATMGATNDFYKQGKWHGRTHRFHDEAEQTYSVGVGGRVYAKVTRTSKAGAVNTRIEHAQEEELSPAGQALNAFTHLSLVRNDRFSTPEGTVVPYSDELATFLHGMMMRLCELADRLEAVFATPETVALAAARGALPLLPVVVHPGPCEHRHARAEMPGKPVVCEDCGAEL